MSPPTPEENPVKQSKAKKRRKYDSPLRRQQRAETRERIVAAGSELVHELPDWDWKSLTFRAVAERAGVSERTVHRYFSSERKLRDAVIERLVEESGVKLDDLHLEDFASTTARVFSYLPTFAVEPAPLKDPTFASMDQRRRDALLQAVVRATPHWSESEREMVAAALDILWTPSTYERLVATWGFDTDRSIGTITWLVDLIENAVRNDKRPDSGGH
jgi:AcrR family transcriptional regulator